jgi:hypothetical protein
MQLAHGKADTPKRHSALLSTHPTHKNAPEAQIQSEASTVPDFLQLESDIQDNFTKPSVEQTMLTNVVLELLEDNVTSIYSKGLANASALADRHAFTDDKQQVGRNASVWPWIRLGSITRRTNKTKEAVVNDTFTKGAVLIDPFAKEPSGIVKNQAVTDEDDSVYFDNVDRGSLLKSVHRNQRPGVLGPFFVAIRRFLVTDYRRTLPWGIAVLTVTGCLVLWLFFTFHFGVTTGVRAQVEALHVSSGQEIQGLFQTKERYDCCHFQPLSPGLLLRLQGKVTPGSQGKLVAPLSRQDCVHFSASASAKRHDGIHALPVAFHSVCCDFTITLLDAPDIQIEVYGEDVALFDIKKGTTEDQRRFSESPDHWQDFILTHRAPGTVGPSSAALRSEKALLDYREVALVAGTVVTCVGELRRSHDGVLRLYPCEEVRPEHPDGAQSAIFGERWRTSWERLETKVAKAPEKVLISDDKRLLRPSRTGWGFHRHSSEEKEKRCNDRGDVA